MLRVVLLRTMVEITDPVVEMVMLVRLFGCGDAKPARDQVRYR